MRKLPLLALVAALGTAACTDPYGRVDPVATGLLGAGIGAAAGLGIAAASQPRRPHWGGGWHQGYYAPRPAYGYGYGPPPGWRRW
ncbi:MAG: hypothetical protein K2X11_05495 [Acetobacteraceae bacterium]|nr:hypothetical protein [Acetobacteraceae bacterium]